MDYLVVSLILFAFFVLTFAIAQAQKNNGLVDIAWGLGFVVSAVVSYFLGKPQGLVPHYFGEATLWWGIFIMAVSDGRYIWLITSPLLITLFLLFVSGVPMLEKKYAGRPDWEDYKAQTSKFFPLPPKQKSRQSR